jgi:DNA-binding NtrC family response regulator
MGLAERPTIEERATHALSNYSWPGNVRELRNVVERAIILAGRAPITHADLALEGESQSQSEFSILVNFPSDGQSLHDITRDVAKGLISEALRRGGTKQDAAKLLNISRYALAHQLRALELEK